MTYGETLGGRNTARSHEAVEIYAAVAEKHGLDLTQMALAWCRTRPFMTSTIFGATTLAQLDVALGSADLELDEDVMRDIATAHQACPLPF